MIEVEIKTYIKDPKFIQKQLNNMNAQYICSLIHEDTYYNMPEGLRDFKKTDEALRIRNSTKFDKFNKEIPQKTGIYLTYKGKKLDNDTKTRRELETKIQNGNNIKKIFELLGFKEVLTVKKERELYKLAYKSHKIEILLDYIPFLDQFFLEVEFIAKSEENVEVIKDLLFEFLDKLGLERKDSIRKSYLELITES
ncbi:MAG: class IV adenylate cyclase [Candidatus Lokiarchaeota archaeon]|nr:class IV adenylate cyclase [Candidatus Lokiarchaeota archaeon]